MSPTRRSALRSLARGGVVTLVGQAVTIVISLVSIVVLSRLLPPSDFGLIAMVGTVTALAGVLKDMGLSVSALKTPLLSQQQASNLFWINTLLSLFTAIAVAASGPALSYIYSEPRLTAITPVLAISFFLNGVQAQFQVQLARSGKFGTLAAIGATANLLGLAVAVGGVAMGIGYWSLVAQTVAAASVEATLKIVASRWHPNRPRRGAETRSFVTSGLDLTAASLSVYVSNNAANVLIGVRMGASDVGLYSRALQLMQMPTNLTSSLLNVVVPMQAAKKGNGEDTLPLFLRIQTLMGVGVGLCMVIASAAAPTVFRLVLGADWAPAAPLFQILAVGGTALALSNVCYWTFLVEGASREILKKDIAIRLLTTLLIVAGAFISVTAIAVCYSTALVLSWLIEVWWLDRTTDVNGRAFASNGLLTVAASALGILVSVIVSSALDVSWIVQLILSIIAGCAVFFVALAATPGGRQEIRAVVQMAASSRRPKR